MAPVSSLTLRVGLVGTRGVPARYGGFETCVEEVGRRLAARGHEVVVYCRTDGKTDQQASYQGMTLVHLPALRKRSLETISHTGLSGAHLLRHPVDAAIVFNCANAPWLPLLRMRGIPFATHVDGLEWQRAKWGRWGQRYYRTAEKLSVRWSDALIADAAGIAEYYRSTHDARTERIAYGAPRVDQGDDRLQELGLRRHGYHLIVARFEPENHVLEAVSGYTASSAGLPLVVVGSAPYADEYTRQVSKAADDRVRLLGGVWDQGLLDQLYAGARTYLHGHSVGGTNPSLLRALGAGVAVDAFDVSFNREVLGEAGRYWQTPDDVRQLIEESERNGAAADRRAALSRVAAGRYDWDEVADRYETLLQRLATGTTVRSSDTQPVEELSDGVR